MAESETSRLVHHATNSKDYWLCRATLAMQGYTGYAGLHGGLHGLATWATLAMQGYTGYKGYMGYMGYTGYEGYSGYAGYTCRLSYVSQCESQFMDILQSSQQRHRAVHLSAALAHLLRGIF